MLKKNICRIFILAILILGINITVSEAAISASSKTVNSGENVSILITSNIPVTSYKVTMTDNGGLSFVTSTGGTGEGTSTITDAKATGMTSLATYKLKAPTVSKETTYTVSFTATAMEDESFNAISNSTTTAQITVKPVQNSGGSNNSGNNTGTTNNGENTPNKPSSDANLLDLGITKYDFKGFKPENVSYNTTVPNDVTSVSVYAKVKASGAVYSVSGNKDLDVGTNKVTITVTAPDGKTKKNYYIYVARQAAENEEVVPNVIDENQTTNEDDKKEEALGLLSIAIEDGYEIYLEPEFKPDVYEYTINYKGDLDYIPFNAIANRENVKVEIQGNEKLQDGENTIVIKVIDEAKKEVVEYTIKVNKNIDSEEEEVKTEEKEEKQEDKDIINIPANKIDKKVLIVAAGVLAIIVFVVIIFVVIKRKHRYLRLEEQNDEPTYKPTKKKRSKGKHF